MATCDHFRNSKRLRAIITVSEWFGELDSITHQEMLPLASTSTIFIAVSSQLLVGTFSSSSTISSPVAVASCGAQDLKTEWIYAVRLDLPVGLLCVEGIARAKRLSRPSMAR